MIGLLLGLAARIGADPAETEDARVRRLIWSTTLICAAPLSALMAVAFAVLGLAGGGGLGYRGGLLAG